MTAARCFIVNLVVDVVSNVPIWVIEYWNDRDVGLTLGEYNIVHLLASNAGRWMTYRTVYDRVHYEGFTGGRGEDGYQTNVRAIIRRIRKKFLRCDETFAEIENFMGLGYRWATPTGAG